MTINRLGVVGAAGGVIVLLTIATAGQRPPLDPDSPAVEAAARAALANAKVLEISGTTLDIVGVSLGVDSLIKDLGAKVTAQEITIELSADVLFDFDKFDLKPGATDSLTKVGALIASYPTAPLLWCSPISRPR